MKGTKLMEKYLVLDTETTNSLDDPFAYDIGFAVVDGNGKVYETHSYVVADFFLNSSLMDSAYFKEKVPHYWEDIKSGKRMLRRLKTVRFILRDVCNQYGIKKIFAHNASFDYKSCNYSQRYNTSSKYRYFFPFGIEIWDTLRMAREVFGKDSEYVRFCEENSFLTPTNKPKLTAEVLYRYLSNNLDFEESHTGLEDVLIEKEILVECLRRGCKVGKLYPKELL